MNIIAIMAHSGMYHKDEPMRELHDALTAMDFQLVYPHNSDDLLKLVEQNARICGVIFDWDQHSLALCAAINDINEFLPLYAFISTQSTLDVSLNEMRMTLYFFEYVLKGADVIAKRIRQYTTEYIDTILPPFTKALFAYVREGKYTFCTPGHMAGTAFQKSPVGCLFYDFFGANTLKADISVSVTELGSLLDHSGPHREAEAFIANTFNADRSYMVTNGTSTANKIVGMYSAPAGSTVLIDRNCHKSVTHLLMMSDITPIYLHPVRNAYGLLGGIPEDEFRRQNIQSRVDEIEGASWPVYAVITNSTYDGLLYNVDKINNILEVKAIHYDSAWVPYTNFHPIYQGKSGMTADSPAGKVIYETQSTHKLLAAFSQASMIHIKGISNESSFNENSCNENSCNENSYNENTFNENTFNEAYMMHTTTSPNYGIVSSIEMAAAMMRGNPGKRLIQRSIERALHFRHEMVRLREESEGWFYRIWQPAEIAETAECWPLSVAATAAESWHGFPSVDAEHMYLDPIKVTVLTPGMSPNGSLEDKGIPAALVSKYLDERGIIVEKIGHYSLLFLFSIGIDKTKALSLLRALTDFKRDYDRNLRVKSMLPSLYALDPVYYAHLSIQDVAKGIHQLMADYHLPTLMQQAFNVLPTMALTPYQMFQQELRGNVEQCELKDLIGKINANMILPYPPGVPLIMPGEMVTQENRQVLDFLLMLSEIGEKYPGFETDIHGLTRSAQGHYYATVLKTALKE